LGQRPVSKEEEMRQKAVVALVNVWFENNKLRLKRKSKVDPWEQYDNFRINSAALREIKLTSG